MKRGLGHAPVLLLLALATGCATASGPQPSAAERRRAAREAALSQQREVIAQQQRADRVAQRLLRALPPPAAGDSVVYLGLRLADAGQSDDHRLMAEALGVPEARRPLVVFVDPRGPAADADLLPGDQILAVAGSPVTRIEDVQARAAERTPGVPLSLRVFRGGQQHRVVVVPRLRARAIDVVVTDQPWIVNAFARRDGVFVPTGILQLLPTDHELAVVIGHELAHLVRGHLAASYRTARGAAFARDLEREADRVGLELAHRAGYHPAAGVNLWSTLARVRGAFTREWLSSHPGYAERRRTAAAIARRLRSEQILRAVLPRLPLLPVTSTAP